MRTSPLNAAHIEAGGRFIEFAGWRLPVHYGSILAEARAVRESAGMFDVSHMGRFLAQGPSVFDALDRLGTNDLRKIGPGRAQYTLWCNEDGGVRDDLIVDWLGDEDFLIVVNASRREDDYEHISEHVAVTDSTLETAMIAVQGPSALAAAQSLGAPELRRFGVARATIAGVDATISRTGYTGEDGVEIICAAADAPGVWSALREGGVAPCGLGARDALRMEVGYPLYGHELGPDITPLEAGVGFAVAFEGRDFLGAKAMRDVTPHRKLMGFVAQKPCVPMPDDPVAGGLVTSGGTSVVLGKPIGLALVDPAVSPGPATLRTRGKEIPVEMSALPLIPRSRPS